MTPWTEARQAPLSMNSPGKNTGGGCHFYLHGIFPTQRLNLHLLHWQSFLTTEPPEKSIKSTKMSIHYEHCVYSPLLLPPSLTPDTFYFLFHDTWCYLTHALFTCLLPLSPHDDGTLLCSLSYPQHLAQCMACG